MDVSKDCPIFLGTLYYLRNGYSYELQILHAHYFIGSIGTKAQKNFEKSSHGRSQGLPKIFRAPIHRAHRAVIFAIAQLSCKCWPTTYSLRVISLAVDDIHATLLLCTVLGNFCLEVEVPV